MEPTEAAPASLVPAHLHDIAPRTLVVLTASAGYYTMNTTIFPFLELFQEMLQCQNLSLIDQCLLPAPTEAVNDCAARECLQREALRAYLIKCGGSKSAVRQRVLGSPLWGDFLVMYQRFVQEAILPLFDETSQFAVQRQPTIRVHSPGGTVLTRRSGDHNCIGMHRDSDFGHQQHEVTFVVPLTDMFGSNSVWAETGSGEDDFAPLTMQYGYFHRWQSAQSRHYNMVNQTCQTRISFDFRVIPMEYYKESSGTYQTKFQIGDYFELMTAAR